MDITVPVYVHFVLVLHVAAASTTTDEDEEEETVWDEDGSRDEDNGNEPLGQVVPPPLGWSLVPVGCCLEEE